MGGSACGRQSAQTARDADLHGVLAVRVGGRQLHRVQYLEHDCPTRLPCGAPASYLGLFFFVFFLF